MTAHAKLKVDQIENAAHRHVQDAGNILKHEHLRPQASDDPTVMAHELTTGIAKALPSTRRAERLAWWATNDNVYLAGAQSTPVQNSARRHPPLV
jgi:hypothetical protein